MRSGVGYRIEELKKHLHDRNVYEKFDVIFVTDYDKNHPLCRWTRGFFAPHVSIEEVSGLVKYYEIFKKAVDDNLEEFVIIDDDVIFIENWYESFKKPLNFFEIMGLGVNYHVTPGNDSVITGNVGGGECLRCSKKFAEFMLNNFDVNQGIDIVFGAVLLYHGMTLSVTPVCHQTSILDDKSEQKHSNTKYSKDWITYTRTYRPTGVKYEELKTEYEKYMKMKKIVEDDFYKLYNRRIDVTNAEFIIKRYMSLEKDGNLAKNYKNNII